MRFKQFVIMMMIICGCVSAGCKNKEVQESDKTASESSRLARQEVEYIHMKIGNKWVNSR